MISAKDRNHKSVYIQLYMHILFKINEKCSLNDGFNTILMMILESGLLFWGVTLYIACYQMGSR